MAAKKKAAAKKAPATKSAAKKSAPKKTPAASTATSKPKAGAQAQTAAHSGIAHELLAAGSVTPRAGESYGVFAERLATAVGKLDDAAFNKLSAPAREWFDSTVDPINEKKYDTIPELPGLVMPDAVQQGADSATEQSGTAGEASGPAETQTQQPESTTGAEKPKRKAGDGTPKTPKAPRGPRMGLLIAEMVAKNPRLTYEQLCDKLDVKSKKIAFDDGSYIAARFEEAKHCTKTMQEKAAAK